MDARCGDDEPVGIWSLAEARRARPRAQGTLGEVRARPGSGRGRRRHAPPPYRDPERTPEPGGYQVAWVLAVVGGSARERASTVAYLQSSAAVPPAPAPA